MKIYFSKLHGLGNDYLFLDALKFPEFQTLDYSSLALNMSHRRLGPGADGIVVILPSEKATVSMRIFNADGSEAENCGNALRCLARICRERGYTSEDSFGIETKNRLVTIYLDEKDTGFRHVKVDIGKACFDRAILPMTGDGACDRVLISIPGSDKTVDASCVSVGNPHCVLFWPDYTHADVLKYGPVFESHPIFPEKINVGFCRIEDNSLISLSVWERGSGFTGSCGTGAAAAFATGRQRHLVNEYCSVRMPGGHLDFFEDTNKSIQMIGPATFVYDGIWILRCQK
jgi:diaminopimelate epimerase